MGICASCLGLNRHSSHQVDERDPLLDDSNSQAQYGATDGEEYAEPDEEELRREREEFERITAEATSKMIDMSQANVEALNQQIMHTNHDRQHAAYNGIAVSTDGEMSGAGKEGIRAWLSDV